MLHPKLDQFLWTLFPGLMARYWAPKLGAEGRKIAMNCLVPSADSVDAGIMNVILSKLSGAGIKVNPVQENAAESVRQSGYWRSKLGEGVDVVVLADCRTWTPMPDLSTGSTYGVPSRRFSFRAAYQADNGAEIKIPSIEAALGFDRGRPTRQVGRDSWAFYTHPAKRMSNRQSAKFACKAFYQVVHALYIATRYPVVLQEGWYYYDTANWPYGESPATVLSFG